MIYMMVHLMSVRLVENRSAEDDDVADDAEAVEDAQSCHQAEEGGLQHDDNEDEDGEGNNGDYRSNPETAILKAFGIIA